MSRGSRMLVVAAVTMLTAVFTAPPAGAADTTTTFALTAGSLSISAPAAVSLGSVAAGALTVSGSLGSVTVTDDRGSLTASWTATATASDFTTGGATAAETVLKANVAYAPGSLTASSPPAGVFVPTSLASMAAAGTVCTGAAIGNNSASWNPTLTIGLAGKSIVGTYTGTITHSVS